MPKKQTTTESAVEYIYCTWFRHKSGKIIRAADFGLKAFRFPK